MLKQLASLCLAAACLALPGTSQGTCSALSVSTVLDPLAPVQTLMFDLVGTTPSSPAVLAISANTGTSVVNMRAFGTLVLGLARPFNTVLLGLTDGKGDLTRTYRVPANLGITRYVQTITLSAKTGSPTAPALCTSNVATLTL